MPEEEKIVVVGESGEAPRSVVIELGGEIPEGMSQKEFEAAILKSLREQGYIVNGIALVAQNPADSSN